VIDTPSLSLSYINYCIILQNNIVIKICFTLGYNWSEYENIEIGYKIQNMKFPCYIKKIQRGGGKSWIKWNKSFYHYKLGNR